MPAALDIEKSIKEVFENQSFTQSAEDLQFAIEIKGDPIVYTDEFRLNIILANLISNAIRYRNPKAKPSYIHFDIEILPKEAKIKISDNGIGIPSEHLSNIFQMFYRANAKISGSGLGLYIVKEALNKMKGSIEVSSEEGKGTVFRIVIPNLKEA